MVIVWLSEALAGSFSIKKKAVQHSRQKDKAGIYSVDIKM